MIENTLEGLKTLYIASVLGVSHLEHDSNLLHLKKMDEEAYRLAVRDFSGYPIEVPERIPVKA